MADTHSERVEALTRPVLEKVFRDELISTEAEFVRREGWEDEPTGMLPERLRAERRGRQKKEPPNRNRRMSWQSSLLVE